MTELDRGHRLLIRHGLQIQAQVFHSTLESLDIERWKQSYFTTVNLHSGEHPSSSGYPANPAYVEMLGPAPGIPWARWIMSMKQIELSKNELPYLANLISVQYFDEKDIRDPEFQTGAAAFYESFRESYPKVLTLHNSFGGAFYPKEIHEYMEATRPDILSMDSYPFRLSHIRKPPSHPAGGSPRVWYEHMQKWRLQALAGHDGTGRRPIPYGQYLDTFSFTSEEPRHLTGESELRLNQFASWTFGFTFVSAFIYNSPDGHGIESILFEGLDDQKPTRAFADIAETNRQSLNLGSTLVRLQNTDVRIIPGRLRERDTGKVADNPAPAGLGTVQLWDVDADPYMTAVSAENIGPMNDGLPGDVLIGYFKPLLESDDGPDYVPASYFMIANGLTSPTGPATATQQRIRIEFNFGKSGVTSLQRRSRLTGRVQTVPLIHADGSRYRLDLILDGGTGDLFKYNTGARFVE